MRPPPAYPAFNRMQGRHEPAFQAFLQSKEGSPAIQGRACFPRPLPKMRYAEVLLILEIWAAAFSNSPLIFFL